MSIVKSVRIDRVVRTAALVLVACGVVAGVMFLSGCCCGGGHGGWHGGGHGH
jgi:hypothetical protein